MIAHCNPSDAAGKVQREDGAVGVLETNAGSVAIAADGKPGERERTSQALIVKYLNAAGSRWNRDRAKPQPEFHDGIEIMQQLPFEPKVVTSDRTVKCKMISVQVGNAIKGTGSHPSANHAVAKRLGIFGIAIDISLRRSGFERGIHQREPTQIELRCAESEIGGKIERQTFCKVDLGSGRRGRNHPIP